MFFFSYSRAVTCSIHGPILTSVLTALLEELVLCRNVFSLIGFIPDPQIPALKTIQQEEAKSACIEFQTIQKQK